MVTRPFIVIREDNSGVSGRVRALAGRSGLWLVGDLVGDTVAEEQQLRNACRIAVYSYPTLTNRSLAFYQLKTLALE